jgi:hypothetical protein
MGWQGVLAQQNPPPAEGKPPAAAANQSANETAESDESQTATLAKAAQNPVANLISFPLQDNTAFVLGRINALKTC